ncbi:hypothetical protein HPB47_005524 [Ixodes persulcatus]|uniref:Uncharacterized protein n=1 Tax=Ixodes persulcatus TaxID=34615 RepID=A0AC60PE17_IXOPE|nr:hypothetical protein HPB47_005524 [Ixodes persulcatus]
MTTLPLFVVKETPLMQVARFPSPWSQARLLRLGIFGVLIIAGGIMLALNLFYESREGYTSVAEASGISTGLLGFGLVLASAGVLLVDVLVILTHVARRPCLSVSLSPASSSMSEFYTRDTASVGGVH